MDKPEEKEPAVPADPPEPEPAASSRFPELDALEKEIARRLRDNQRFLERFLDDNFVDEEADGEDEGPEGEEL